MTVSAFADTAYKQPIYIHFDQLCSRNHLRSWLNNQFYHLLPPILHPGWLTEWNKKICVGTAWDNWRESSGQSKMPSQMALASISQIFDYEGGYDFNYIVSSPSTVSNQSITSPAQMSRQGVPGPLKELMPHAWVCRWALLWHCCTTLTTAGQTWVSQTYSLSSVGFTTAPQLRRNGREIPSVSVLFYAKIYLFSLLYAWTVVSSTWKVLRNFSLSSQRI